MTYKANNDYIPDDAINDCIKLWHEGVPERHQETATPSTLTDCPRVVWLKYKQGVPPTNPMTWAVKQRLLLGRNFENKIAEQLKDQGLLLYHWRDDYAGQSPKFGLGEGLTRLEGTPDLLLNFNNLVYISDAKTSRGDSFRYLPQDDAIWDDYFWYKYRLQVTAYYMLAHKNKGWFVAMDLPLPEACHLFSFAMDDGVVRRSLTWKPTKKDIQAVLDYTKRWNSAYQAESIPDCTCETDGGGKAKLFCPYGWEFEQTSKGKKIVKSCCKEVASV